MSPLIARHTKNPAAPTTSTASSPTTGEIRRELRGAGALSAAGTATGLARESGLGHGVDVGFGRKGRGRSRRLGVALPRVQLKRILHTVAVGSSSSSDLRLHFIFRVRWKIGGRPGQRLDPKRRRHRSTRSAFRRAPVVSGARSSDAAGAAGTTEGSDVLEARQWASLQRLLAVAPARTARETRPVAARPRPEAVRLDARRCGLDPRRWRLDPLRCRLRPLAAEARSGRPAATRGGGGTLCGGAGSAGGGRGSTRHRLRCWRRRGRRSNERRNRSNASFASLRRTRDCSISRCRSSSSRSAASSEKGC